MGSQRVTETLSTHMVISSLEQMQWSQHHQGAVIKSLKCYWKKKRVINFAERHIYIYSCSIMCMKVPSEKNVYTGCICA